MTEQDDFKDKVKTTKNPRKAHGELMPGEEDNVNANVSEKEEDEMDPIDRVVARTKKKQEKGKTAKELVGVYFRPEVKDQLNDYVQNLEKGAKSEFVSAAVESALKRKGIWREK
ncbi:hypothetical protein [Halobacillus sp. H74]|uniref:hypothetical protein n=1 Tax=Halobacillus sp. H74 TaxID=3457436 RepID=UPI003FCCDC9A